MEFGYHNGAEQNAGMMLLISQLQELLNVFLNTKYKLDHVLKEAQ